MNPKHLALALFATLAVSAQATVVMIDNFEAPAGQAGSNHTPSGWSVANGTVDTVGPGYFGSLCNGSGTCVDLDGSTNNAGELSRSVTLTAGTAYQLAFDLAGNRRGAGTETGSVSFGSALLAYSMSNSAANAPYQHFMLDFTPTTSGPFQLVFANNGGDNIGAILDNVSISAVPEPQSLALIALGLLALAGTRRRR